MKTTSPKPSPTNTGSTSGRSGTTIWRTSLENATGGEARQGKAGGECRGAVETRLCRSRATHVAVSRTVTSRWFRGLWLLGFRSQKLLFRSQYNAGREVEFHCRARQTERQRR